MSHFAAKYTEEQRNAIRDACVDGGLSVRQAVKAAKNGALAGLPPFDMPYGTAADLAGKERLRREGLGKSRLNSLSDTDARDQVRAELKWMLEQRIKKHRRLVTQGKHTDQDLAALAKAAKDVLALDPPQPPAAKKNNTDPSTNGKQEPKPTSTALTDLAAAHRKQHTTTPDTQPKPEELDQPQDEFLRASDVQDSELVPAEGSATHVL